MSQATDYAGVEEAAGFQPSGVSLSESRDYLVGVNGFLHRFSL